MSVRSQNEKFYGSNCKCSGALTCLQYRRERLMICWHLCIVWVGTSGLLFMSHENGCRGPYSQGIPVFWTWKWQLELPMHWLWCESINERLHDIWHCLCFEWLDWYFNFPAYGLSLISRNFTSRIGFIVSKFHVWAEYKIYTWCWLLKYVQPKKCYLDF
jgi:hypothetical protein